MTPAQVSTIDLLPDTSRSPPNGFEAVNDATSDYGLSSGDEAEINNILLQLESAADTSFVVTDIEDYEAPRGVYLPKILGFEQRCSIWTETQNSSEVARNGSNPIFENPATRAARTVADRERSASVQSHTEFPSPDTLSPLERFRRPPKKALSVTDLVSPAWCELQYFYTLAKHGRKKRTPAMKQGTTIHKKLEDEIHTTVPVDITTREDGWGLRIWNIIQGLRTLRDTGMTRELEVWGVIGGEVVNGIIDELSHTCPDPELERESEQRYKSALMDKEALPECQTSITDYLLSPAGGAGRPMSDIGNGSQPTEGLKMPPPPPRRKADEKRIYITDIKTRSVKTLPAGSSIRPTILQLHLYYHMLTNLALGNVPIATLAERYNLDTNATFSDSFIVQVGSLNQDFFDALSSQQEASAGSSGTPGSTMTASQIATSLDQIASSQDSMEVLLKHNSLSALWSFMLHQLEETFLLPAPISPLAPKTRLSPLLTATYLSSSTSQILGSKSVLFSPEALQKYLDDEMQWWRGEREAKGVDLQEAWKCRSCDFRDDCSWIHERDEAAVAEVRSRRMRREEVGLRSPKSEV